MNNKRFTLIFVIAFTVAMAAAGVFHLQPASAHSGGGSGSLSASGDGLAGVRGNGTVEISGNGILWIKDHSGDVSIVVNGNGVRRDLPGGWIRYSGFNGLANISGSSFSVGLSGYDINLKATGTGHFMLRGHGEYTVEVDGIIVLRGSWNEKTEVFSFP